MTKHILEKKNPFFSRSLPSLPSLPSFLFYSDFQNF